LTRYYLLLEVNKILFPYYENFDNNENYPPISIIYYCYLRKDKWEYIVLPQITDLVNNKLLNYADLHICLSGDKEEIEKAELEIKKIIEPYLHKTEFIHIYENLYEYPGIEKLHIEATKNPEKIFLYFH